MTRSATVFLTLLAFAALLLSVAAWANRRTHNAADFVLANRRLGAWLVAFGYTANTVNAWMAMTIAAAAFSWGISAAWIWGAIVCGSAVNLWFVAPRARATSLGQGNATLIQILSCDTGDRLQPVVARSAVFIVLMAVLLQTAAMLRFADLLLANDFGFSIPTVAITSIALVAVCVFAGGLRAACVGDAVQVTVVIVLSLFLLLPASIALGGWEHVQPALASLGESANDWFGGRHGVVALAFAAGVCGIGFGSVGQPQVMTRFMAARDEATLRTARWLAFVWIALLLAVLLLCGWAASMLYAGLEHPEQALFAIANRLLPPTLAAFISASLLAALIANVGSQLHVIATSLAVDLRRANAPLSLPWNRAALVLAAILAICACLYAPEKIFQHAIFGYTALGAAFGPLLLVRLSGKKIRPGSTLGAMWAGFILSLLFHLLPDSPGDFLERVLPFVASLGVALTGGERRRNPDRADRSQETVHDRVPI